MGVPRHCLSTGTRSIQRIDLRRQTLVPFLVNKLMRQVELGTAALAPLLSSSCRAALDLQDTVRRTRQNVLFRLGHDPRLPVSQRKKVVILGTGWASLHFVSKLDITRYDVTIISPRNYFTFTPLLPSVCAGTLSSRSCLEPVRDKFLMRGGKSVMKLHEAWATGMDTETKQLECAAVSGEKFSVPYDYLIMAVGAAPNTFGIPGVAEHCCFLKELENARDIHRSLLENFERADIPTTSEEERRRLLHFVVVGGGPTGVETAAEIADFIKNDAQRHFPAMVPQARVTLVEMLPKLLPTFNERVSAFTLANLKRLGVSTLLQSRVTRVTPTTISIQPSHVAGEKGAVEHPYGLTLWASGVAPVPFVQKLLPQLPTVVGPRWLRADERLRAIGLPPDVYAIGDCSIIMPKLLSSAADELYEEASQSEHGAGTTWLKKNAERLSFDFPQLSSTVFSTRGLTEANGITHSEFSALLKAIDAAYRPPPPTAQNAHQEGAYLANVFNRCLPLTADIQQSRKDIDGVTPAYIYKWRGSMAYVGDGKSVIETPSAGTWLGGHVVHYIWRLFYWTEQMSGTNRVLCALDWLRVALRGREVGRTRVSVPVQYPTN